MQTYRGDKHHHSNASHQSLYAASHEAYPQNCIIATNYGIELDKVGAMVVGAMVGANYCSRKLRAKPIVKLFEGADS